MFIFILCEPWVRLTAQRKICGNSTLKQLIEEEKSEGMSLSWKELWCFDKVCYHISQSDWTPVWGLHEDPGPPQTSRDSELQRTPCPRQLCFLLPVCPNCGINCCLLSYLCPTAVPETEESDEALFCGVWITAGALSAGWVQTNTSHPVTCSVSFLLFCSFMCSHSSSSSLFGWCYIQTSSTHSLNVFHTSCYL